MLRRYSAQRLHRSFSCSWLLLFWLIAALFPVSMHGQEVYRPEEPFPKDAPVPTTFKHTLHEERAGVTNCTTCHHHPELFSDSSGGPQDVGRPCSDCHGRTGTKPKLRYAYHAMCINCHYRSDAAPLTCDGCHPGLQTESITDRGFRDKQRPRSVFDHTAHTQRLGFKNCTACHHLYRSGPSLSYSIPGQECSDCHLLDMENESVPDLQDSYHHMCLDCHEQQGQGALACGECHVRE